MQRAIRRLTEKGVTERRVGVGRLEVRRTPSDVVLLVEGLVRAGADCAAVLREIHNSYGIVEDIFGSVEAG